MAKNLHVSQCALALSALIPLISVTLDSGLVPFVTSQPGVGKSSIAKQYAEKHNLKFIDVRLAGFDPTLIDGFPMVDKENKRAFFGHQEMWPLASDPLPVNQKILNQSLQTALDEGKFTEKDFEDKTDTFTSVEAKLRETSTYDGWFILLDELTSAPQSVQAAAYRLILDREVGDQPLHPNVKMMAAGNRIIDNAIAGKLGTALQSRVVHYEVKPNAKSFKEWAINNNINPRVLAFTDFRPETITDYDPNHTDVTFSCSRTIEFLSKQVDTLQAQGFDLADRSLTALYAGTIGYAFGQEFRTFMQVFGRIPSINDILANPTGIPIPQEPDQVHAIAAMVGENLTPQNADVLMDFLVRTPAESQVTSLRTAIKRDRAIGQAPKVQKWVMSTAAKMRA